MTPRESDYVPVACAFHDRLEHLVMRHELCEILVRDLQGNRQVRGVIRDVVTRDGAEFILMAGSDEQIRLDAIAEIRSAG